MTLVTSTAATTAAQARRSSATPTVGGPRLRSRTRKLTARMAAAIAAVLGDPLQLGPALLTDSSLFLTPGGRLASDLGDRETAGRESTGSLFDCGLLEAVYHESYRFLGRADAPGFVRVTQAGRRALKSGRYRANAGCTAALVSNPVRAPSAGVRDSVHAIRYTISHDLIPT